jgi:hypothetical protein
MDATIGDQSEWWKVNSVGNPIVGLSVAYSPPTSAVSGAVASRKMNPSARSVKRAFVLGKSSSSARNKPAPMLWYINA